MKKIIYLKLMAMLLMALTAPALAVAESITYTATYDYSNLTIGTDTLAGETYAVIIYRDLFNDGVPGAPSLPVDYIKFSVPYNATNFSVSTTTIAAGTNDIGLEPYPCQIPVPTDSSAVYTITLPDTTIYDSGEFYPSLTQNAWIVDEGFLAGENHIVTVAVMPISYRFSSGHELLRKSGLIDITLTYDFSTVTPLSPIEVFNSQARDEGYQLTQNLVVNPSSVPVFAPQNSLPDPLNNLFPSPAINNGLPYFPYLIITTPELSHSLRRIVAFKRQKGYNVKLITVNEIMADPYAQYGDIVSVNGVPTVTFNDSAGIIRQYLKMARYYNGSKYLLLAGTAVPYRLIPIKHPITHKDYSMVSDLYYSDLNGNWSQTGYHIDKNSEYSVGRILAKNDMQIVNYTDKLLKYEINPGNGDFSYLRRALYTEATGMLNSSRSVGAYLNTACPDTTIIQEQYHKRHPKACEIIDSINSNKYGFWSTFNHGGPSCITTYGVGFGGAYSGHMYRLWGLDSYKVAESSYTDSEINNGLNNIENEDYPMISYSISCVTMPYDVTKPLYDDMPMNFGESFTTGRNYGGPAYLGNTRDGLYPSSLYLEQVFAKQLINGNYKIGDAEILSKSIYSTINSYSYSNYLSSAHNLLGDPTIEMWTDTPQVYSNIGITRSNSSISISGIDADSTIVAYYANDGQIGTDTISTSSVTLNGISPNSTIMLYKHNKIPYIAPLALQNITLSNNQYVIASDVNAGNNIDNSRTNGDVIVPDGVEYEIEASGKVTLEDGFKVEKGATFAVYPSCF